MSLLNDIYRNKLQPFGEMNQWWNEEYVSLVKEISDAEDKISEISPEVKELFEEYQQLQTKMDNITMYHEFSTGVKFGAQLMKEMLEKME